MGNTKSSDSTAQGVCKVRHYEAMLPPEQRLYNDPYAYAFYPGSSFQQWMGTGFVDTLYGWMGLKGFSEMISIRTKWLDDNIKIAVKENGAKQLIILGAGYDTRGFRLECLTVGDDGSDNEKDIKVWEVDQPDVQKRKQNNLQWLIDKGGEGSEQIADRINSKQVEFVPVDFNKDSVEKRLSSQGFQSNLPSVITLEGVTQYIPKEATADTLKKLKTIVASGSILLMTYVDQKVLDDDPEEPLPKSFRMVRDLAGKVGEPWISGWTKPGIDAFLNECGYQLLSDTDVKDYNDKYLEPVGRKLEDKDLLTMERFVVAKVL